ncbi:MAG: hypothetical protein ACLPVW_02200 [Terriglobales bacterium]
MSAVPNATKSGHFRFAARRYNDEIVIPDSLRENVSVVYIVPNVYGAVTYKTMLSH